jgi:hypothetical protein
MGRFVQVVAANGGDSEVPERSQVFRKASAEFESRRDLPPRTTENRTVRASLRVVSERRGVGSNLDLNKLVPCRMFCAKKGDMVRSPTLELEASRPTNSLQGSAAPTPRCVYVPGPSVLAPNDSSPILDRDGWSKRFSAQSSLRTGCVTTPDS